MRHWPGGGAPERRRTAQVTHSQAHRQQHIEFVEEEAACPRRKIEDRQQGRDDQHCGARLHPHHRCAGRQQQCDRRRECRCSQQLQQPCEQDHAHKGRTARHARARSGAGRDLRHPTLCAPRFSGDGRSPHQGLGGNDEAPASSRGDQQVGRIGAQPREPELARFDRQAQHSGTDGRSRSRKAQRPGEHAHRQIHHRHGGQAGQRVRFGGVVVIVERQETQLIPLRRCSAQPLPGEGEPAIHRHQQHQIGRSASQRVPADGLADALEAQPATALPKRQTGGHTDRTRQHRGTLGYARGDEQLRDLDRQPKDQPDQRRSRQRRRCARARPLAEQRAERRGQRHFDEQLQRDDQRAHAEPGQPPAPQLRVELPLQLAP